MAEALGMSLPGCASIPAPYRERGQMAYATGMRIVDLVREDVRPSQIMTHAAFENAIAVASALGASTNCPPHLIAIARHSGIDLSLEDWQCVGEDVPLLVNCMPAGEYLAPIVNTWQRGIDSLGKGAAGLMALVEKVIHHGRRWRWLLRYREFAWCRPLGGVALNVCALSSW